MINDIQDIRYGLGTGRYMNEAAISRGIVMRLLTLLEWPVFDTRIVWPEFATEGRRVDYALCHPAAKPTVFIEVKQVGNDVAADRQLFEYAFHLGVPLAILTTGQEWHFFLPSGQGDYSERRVYKLDLLEREPEECESRLTRYLHYRRVCNGDAFEAAQEDYRSIAKEREIRRTLPDALVRLVEEQDELLLDLIAEKVESLCGYRPDSSVVANFLASRFSPLVTQGAKMPQAPSRMAPAQVRVSTISSETKLSEVDSRKPVSGNEVVLTGSSAVLRGKHFQSKRAIDVYLWIFQELGKQDAEFFRRFHAIKSQSGGRPHIAPSRKELYPKSEELAEDSAKSTEILPDSGWWLDKNISNDTKMANVILAAEVAGMELGNDLKVRFESAKGSPSS